MRSLNTLAHKIVPPKTKAAVIHDMDGSLKHINYFTAGEGPVLLLLGGTGQTVATFSQHFKSLAKSNRLLVPELRCQGATDLDPALGTMDQHCVDLVRFLQSVGVVEPCRVAGLSFGGRVALTFAAHHPNLVSRLSVTGVPFHRPSLGRLILNSWKIGLESGQFRSTAWSMVLNGYSESFIRKHESKISSFVDMIVESNDISRLHNLLAKSHVAEDDPLFSIPACAQRVGCPTQVLAGKEDRIANEESVRELASNIKNAEFLSVHSGHLVPFEQPLWWRNHLLEFVNRA